MHGNEVGKYRYPQHRMVCGNDIHAQHMKHMAGEQLSVHSPAGRVDTTVRHFGKGVTYFRYKIRDQNNLFPYVRLSVACQRCQLSGTLRII